MIALMSGSFVQRGAPAVFPKYDRAAALIKTNVDDADDGIPAADLVLELPFPYSMGSAEYFASGAIAVLNRLSGEGHEIEYLAFGSESGELEPLIRTAENMLSPSFKAAAAELDGSGEESFIRARNRLYEELFGSALPSKPNDMLALEYIKALMRSGSAVKPFALPRRADFSATRARKGLEDSCSSAREALESQLPKAMYESAATLPYSSVERIAPALLGFLRLAEPSALERFAEVAHGLGYRLCRAAEKDLRADELYRLCVTKKYTEARIRRAVLGSYLGVTEVQLKSKPRYTLLLAMTLRGGGFLSAGRRSESELSVVTKPADYVRLDPEARAQFELMLRAEKVYALTLDRSRDFDMLRCSPYIRKD